MPRSVFRAGIGALAVIVSLSLAAGARSHIRYSGNCDAYGYCEYFNGNTTGTPGGSGIDPINIVWYPYGRGAESVLRNEMFWDSGCGSDQYNNRLLDSGWAWAVQNAQKASTGCATYPGRWHARIFWGHLHNGNSLAYDNWAVSDSHHEGWTHEINVSWQEAEEKVREELAVYWGRDTTANWTYLPRADGCYQGYCYNGWPARINAKDW